MNYICLVRYINLFITYYIFIHKHIYEIKIFFIMYSFLQIFTDDNFGYIINLGYNFLFLSSDIVINK